jgi:hypothetical protein
MTKGPQASTPAKPATAIVEPQDQTRAMSLPLFCSEAA